MDKWLHFSCFERVVNEHTGVCMKCRASCYFTSNYIGQAVYIYEGIALMGDFFMDFSNRTCCPVNHLLPLMLIFVQGGVYR